ncbi:ZapG family protein [Neptunicella sp. SCSIO 80796]|uniref:ZapG family protein n=1 Tax=Neptunicella plasticusilytica TaxID=3117012 RepID=UPI003A4E01A7
MDFITGLLLLLAGGVIGFFVARYWLAQRNDNGTDKNTENTIKEILAEHTSTHLRESRQLISAIEQQCAALKSQFDHFEVSVSDAQQDQEGNKLTYFGDQANAYLRHKATRSKAEPASSDYQPLDYAGGNSGLLSGDRKQRTGTSE